MNRKGSVIVPTLMLIFLCLLWAAATFYLVGVSNATAERQKFSEQAFWLADGAFERARERLPGTLFATGENQNIPLGPGTYDISSAKKTVRDAQGNIVGTFHYQWDIQTKGVVQGQVREIKAVVAALDNRFNVMTRGGIKDFDKCPMASTSLDCSLVRRYSTFSLDTYFKGYDSEAIKALAAWVYTDPANAADVNPVSKLTVVNLINKNSVTITTDNIPDDEAVFLIFDTTLASGNPNNPPSISITGNGVFRGIIWVIGEASFLGTAEVDGAIVVEGSPTQETKMLGNFKLVFDPLAVDEAVNLLSQGLFYLPQELQVRDWREI